ncbi:MAG: hypothetical protein KDB86_09530 [Actinobacteria bacterium]|nr:hypothetical protein [Actinomycetota bacterium]
MPDPITIGLGSYVLRTLGEKARTSAESRVWQRTASLVTGKESQKAFDACLVSAVEQAMRRLGADDVDFAVASIREHLTADRVQSPAVNDAASDDLATWRQDRDYGPIALSLWEAFVVLIEPLFEPIEGQGPNKSAARAWFPEDRREQITVPAMADAILAAFRIAINKNLAANGPLSGLAQALANEQSAVADARHTLKLDDLLARPHAEARIELSLDHPYLFHLPEQPPYFQGRSTELASLHRTLTGADSQGAAIVGTTAGAVLAETGGIGKTALAETYVHRHQDSFAVVAWFDMQRGDQESPQTERSDQAVDGGRLVAVDTAYAALGAELGWCRAVDDPIVKVEQTKRGFERLDLPALLVFDNVEDPADVDPYKPTSGGARTLVTTRYDLGWVDRGLKRIDVEALDDETGAKVLLRRIAGDDAAFAEDDERWESHPDWEQATQVSARLGGLPLALNQIGSLINQGQFGLADFEGVYESSMREVLSRWGDGPLARRPDKEVVWTTWNMSLRAAVEAAEQAELLLQLLALMNPTGTDHSIADDALAIAQPHMSSFERVDTFTALLAFNLIEKPRERGDIALTMHPLLREVTVEAMGPGDAGQGKLDERYRAIHGAIEPHAQGRR